MDLHKNTKAPASALTPAQMLVDLDIAEEHACIERLQEQIREHEERIRVLKSKRNANSKIAKLHPEILQRIFHDIRDSCLTDGPGIRSEDRWGTDFRWHRVARVCRYWRTLALGTPTLWTTISNEYPRWTELCLQRSGEAPLEVFLAWSQWQFTGWKSILQHITRMRVLGIQLYADKDADFSVWEDLQALCHPARGASLILERFHCVQLHKRRPPGPNQHNTFTLSKQWFTRTSRLQHLSLDGVDFSWDDIPFHTIRTLHVRSSDDASARITVDQLQAAVKQLLIAEELTLFRAFSPSAVLPPVPRVKGSLPSLRKLTVSTISSPSLAWLLSCIAFDNPLDLLDIYVYAGRAIPDSTGHAELFLALSRIPQQRFRRLDIRRRYNSSSRPVSTTLEFIELEMSSVEQPGDESSRLRFHVHIDIKGIEAQAHKVTINFCAMAAFRWLSHVSLEKLPTEVLTSTFGVLPHLTSITTRYLIAFTSLVEALTIPLDQPLSDPLNFPALTTITALMFNINDRLDDPRREHYAWELLEVCLIQRCEYGAPIESIFFDATSYNSSEPDALQLQRLKEIVPNVSFDI